MGPFLVFPSVARLNVSGGRARTFLRVGMGAFLVFPSVARLNVSGGSGEGLFPGRDGAFSGVPVGGAPEREWRARKGFSPRWDGGFPGAPVGGTPQCGWVQWEKVFPALGWALSEVSRGVSTCFLQEDVATFSDDCASKHGTMAHREGCFGSSMI
eukprot:233295-Chlamydomonas_euryale.AAC.1